jgi:hypothetical protein
VISENPPELPNNTLGCSSPLAELAPSWTAANTGLLIINALAAINNVVNSARYFICYPNYIKFYPYTCYIFHLNGINYTIHLCTKKLKHATISQVTALYHPILQPIHFIKPSLLFNKISGGTAVRDSFQAYLKVKTP